MPIVDLTDRFCINAKATTRTDYYDAKARGLCLRVTPNGVKTFTLVFSTPEGKRARATLGRYPGMTLARARALAIEGHGQAFEGKDPRGDITASVAALIHGYLAKHVRPNLRSAKTTELRFKRSVLPVIGARPLECLHKRDINRVLDPILARGCQVEAARCFEDLRALFRWGVQRGDLDHSPMDGMRKPITPGPRERVLSDDELRKLWRSLPDALARSRACQLIIKLCILTGQRVGEIAGMTRDELDLKARVWNIPGRRSKNGHAHTVPLSGAAIAIIKDAPGDHFLFPDYGGSSLSGHAVARTIRLAQARFGLAQWTAHDLRRTCVTGMAKLGVPPIVIGHAINHRSNMPVLRFAEPKDPRKARVWKRLGRNNLPRMSRRASRNHLCGFQGRVIR
jgi:integrase